MTKLPDTKYDKTDQEFADMVARQQPEEVIVTPTTTQPDTLTELIDFIQDENTSPDQAKQAILDLIEGARPEKTKIIFTPEPIQGIDRLWLEGRAKGVVAGYNQAIDDHHTNLVAKLGGAK